MVEEELLSVTGIFTEPFSGETVNANKAAGDVWVEPLHGPSDPAIHRERAELVKTEQEDALPHFGTHPGQGKEIGLSLGVILLAK